MNHVVKTQHSVVPEGKSYRDVVRRIQLILYRNFGHTRTTFTFKNTVKLIQMKWKLCEIKGNETTHVIMDLNQTATCDSFD